MKTPLPDVTAIFSAFILMLCMQTSQAGSATWDLNPGSGDWNTATNWTPATVPNGSADTATFARSNTTNASGGLQSMVSRLRRPPPPTRSRPASP